MELTKLFSSAKMPVIAAIVVAVIVLAFNILVTNFESENIISNALAILVVLLVVWSGYSVAKANGEIIDAVKTGAILGIILGVIYRIASEIILMEQTNVYPPYSFDAGGFVTNLVLYIVIFAVLGAIAGVIGGFIAKPNKK